MVETSKNGGYVLAPIHLPINGNYVLTPLEAAVFLRISDNPKWENTLRHYRDTGKLKGTRVGNRFLYTIKELIEFLDRQTK